MTKSELLQRVHEAIDKRSADIVRLGETIRRHPELGFKEFKTARLVEDTADGPAYDIDAVIFEEPEGGRFTGRHSRQFITFPYTPRSVIVQVPDDATDLDKQLAAQAAWSVA